MVQNDAIHTSEDYVNYTFNISSKGVGEVTGELLGLSNTVSVILGDIAFKTAEMLSHTETLAIGTGAAVGALFASATKDAIRFEQQMANVKAIGGESLNVKDIGSAAMEYSNKFGMATASMTEGLEALARAGITTTSVMKGVLEEGVKLSKLEGMDLEDSINDLISTTNLLSVENVDMNDAQYADMVKQMNQHIVSTSESAPINAQNIIQSLQHVGGYASASGMDQDDLFAVIAQLGSRGTKGEMAGTALRAFIAAGQKDTAQRALARIGLNVRDLWDEDGNTMLSISEMKNVLDNALEARGYSKQEKLEFYSDFAGYKQANQIMKIDTTEVEHYKEQIANAWDLGHKLDTILGTVRGNLDRIWQITQNFMTKVGSKFLFIANAILTPVRMLLELINKMPFADTAVAVGMIIIGFSGMLKIINNIVPRFSGFFIQLSQSKKDALSIRGVWKKLPEDISKAKDTLAAMKDPQEMLAIQQQRQLYSKKEMEIVENRLGRVFYVESQWDDERLSDMNKEQKQEYLKNMWDQADNPARQTFINQLKVQDPEKWEKAVNDYMSRTIAHANDAASQVSYDIGDIVTNDKLTSIDRYVAWIWGFISGAPESSNDSDNTPPDASSTTTDNRQRNARINDFKNIRDSIFENKGDYGDYSYHVNPTTGMRQFEYNSIDAIREFEEQVKQEIERKERMYLDFLDDKNIIGGRNRLKKSLTIGAKTDLGYEFSTGANTADIKHILETGHIRSKSSKILDEQLQTIADALGTNITGDTNADMARFYRILERKENKDELLESILDKTQVQWNDKYYNSGRVGFFATNALKQASDGVTAQKIMDKVGVNSIREVQEHFKNVDLDDALLNECVDIMYEDKELVKTLVDEEIKYMYENLARVQNSLERASNGGAGFSSKGEDNWRRDLLNQLQEEKREQIEAQKAKAISYVLDDFNPNDFANFSSSPYDKYDLSAAIEYQNDDILYGDHHEEHLEGFQGYIYPIGGDIARSQRYGNDNFKIRNIKHVPYDDLLQENVEQVFLERHDDIGFDFMETFADWVSEVASFDGGYWETTFNADYADDYWISGFEGGQEVFNELKQEFEEIYRAYIDTTARGAQNLLKSSPLYDSTLSYRGGRLYTPENDFGAFDTITSTSLIYDVAQDFWNENPSQRSILEIYSPEDIPAIIAHTDILNSSNEHLWSRERELTLASGQPYLHIPNPDGFEKKLLMLTTDQQNAVKEIMGEDFEFQKNSPSATFLSAGESLSSDDILMNRFAALLNKEALTKDNMGVKLQDLLMNGAISVDPRYKSGALGATNSDDMIDINTGTIRYHTDNYHNEYGDYANALLDTVLHEMTHVLMMHQERLNYHNNNTPSELGIDNFKTPQLIHGYDEHFVAEYEAQYVSSQVLNRLGIEASEKNQKRMAAFKDVIEQKGYGDQIQYEILDNLVDEMLNNISIIGDITKELSTQFDMVVADTNNIEVSEDMRSILTKIQVFNKDASLYQGPNSTSKKDEINQVLSDMEKDMEKLWNSGVSDKTLMYNLIKQKYLPYIESLNDYSFKLLFDTYYRYASPVFSSKGQTNLSSGLQSLIKEFGEEQVRKELNNILKISNNSQGYRDGHVSWLVYDSLKQLKADGKTRGVTYDELEAHMNETYDESTAISGVKWLKEHITDTMVLKGGKISTSKSKTLKGIEQYNDLSRIPSDFEIVTLPDSGKKITLPIHSADSDEIKQGGMNKYILKHTPTDMREFEGILDILDSDLSRSLSANDIYTIHKAIAKGEGSDWRKRSNLMQADKKLGDKFGVINPGTAADCINRGTDAVCEWCDICYAWIQMFKPNVAKMQIDRSMFFREHTAEQISDYLQKTPYDIFRISQEGDFRSLEDYKKVAKIAELNPDKRFYGYTKVQEVLDYIYENGKPKNLQIQNSLGTWDREGKAKGNYIAANWDEVLNFLKKGYALCQGACEDCKQCLHNIDKVTILRDGSEPFDVGSVAHLTQEGQIAVFEQLRKYAEAHPRAGKKTLEKEAREIINNVSAMPEMLRKKDKHTFASKGEEGDKRLPELIDWTNILAERGNVPGIGYGAGKDNMLDFLTTFHDKIISEDNFRQREGKKPLPKGYSGDRMVLSGKEFFDSEFNISSVKSRLENFGIYWNKKSAKEAEETGMEELINLFDKEAVKEALMREIITANQLKKWHKQLQNSRAIEKYGGYIPWTLEDVEDWDAQKRASDAHLQALIEQRKQQKNTPNTQGKNIEWGMPGLHYDAYSGFKNGKKQFDKNRELREGYIRQFYQSIDSNNINKLDETLSKLVMFSDSYSEYRTVLYRINGLDERQSLSAQGITSLEDLLIPDLRNTNAVSILANGTFFNDEKLNAYKEKVRKENEYKKRIKHNIGEDDTSTLNTPFVMNDEIRKWVEKDYGPSKTASENVKKSVSSQTTLDDFVTSSDNPSRKEEREKNQNIRKLLNSLVINQGQRGIIQKLLIEGRSKDIVKEIQKANRDTSEEDIVDVVKYLINSPAKLNDIKINPEEFSDTPETPSSSLYEQHEKYIHNPELNKQNQEKNNVFVEYSYWEKLRQRVSQALNFAPPGTEDKQNETEKKAQKTIFSLIDLGEKGENFTASILGNLAQKMNNGKTYDGDVFKDASKSFSKMIGPAKEFASILDRLSEDFVFLTPIAEGFNTAVNGADTAVDALTAMSQFLGVVREDKEALDDLKKESKDNPYAKILYSITKLKDSKTVLGQNAWALIQSATSKVNSYIGATLIPMLPTLVPLLLPIIAIIGAVIVAIKAVQFWEKKHAQALKESQEALKEATAKTSTALSQYKDFHKARERETDIIKKQQAARKEAIALYELEIARLNQQKAVKKESDIRNDKVWGEYGRRAEHQKMSWTNAILLGPFAMISKWLSGDFEPQYENYDGTTKNIRQIKESTLGSILPPTGAKGKVARIYDDNKLFFSMVEAYQKPLIDLYNKESKLIEQYGSLDNARASEEFYNAVQEFADATGIQGETAGKMLDWLETENKVNQATQAMQAQVNLITSKAHAEAMAAEYNDVDFASDDLRNAMIYAQADQLYKDAYNEMWWEWFSATLFGILYTIINAMSFGLAYGKERKEYEQKQKAYSEAMKELQEMGVQGLAEIGENTAEHADRRNYGTSTSLYYDTPFGAAQESAALQYAEEQQQIAFNQNHTVYSENEYRAIQENYINYGPEADMELHDIVKREKEYVHQESEDLQKSLNQDMTKAGQVGVDGFKEGLDQHSPGAISRSIQDEMIYSQTFIDEAIPQLSENMYNLGTEMSDNHKNALLVASNTRMEMVDSDASVIVATPFLAHSTSNLGVEMSDSHKESLVIADNTRVEMVNVNDTIEESKDMINPTAYDAGYEAGQEYSKGFKQGLKDLYDQVSTPEALKESLKEHILYRQGLAERPTDTSNSEDDVVAIQKSQQKAIQELIDIGTSAVNQASSSKSPLAKSGNDYINDVLGYEPYDMRISTQANAPPAQGPYGQFYEYIEGKKDPVSKAFYTTRRNVYNNSPTSERKNESDDSLEETTVKATADAGSFVLGDFIERVGSKIITKGSRKITNTILGKVAGEIAELLTKITGKTIFKSGAKTAGKIAPFIGPFVTAGYAIAEHNPFEKHYNEDGSEKRAFQATGEVVGETAGAVIATGLGLAVEGVLTGATFGIGAVPAAIIGAGVEMVAGAILEPIGEAIGGTIGWLVDEVVNTPIKDLWGGFNDALGGIPGQVVDFIDQSPIGEAGHWVFSQLDNLTGGWLGDTWEYVKNSSIAQITGLDQLGGALQGLGEWLFGSGEEQQQIPTPDQITDEQIMELEQAGMLDDYLAAYGLDKEQTNILDKAKTKTKPLISDGPTVIIKNININTEDDPEKIKSALMNLIIEMQEQVNPRQVSRTVGEPPATQSTSTDQNQNNTAQAQGTDPQSGTQNNNTNSNTSPNTNT